MATLDRPHLRGRVPTQERAAEVMALCEARGWYVTLELAPGKPEDLSDIARQMSGLPREATPALPRRPGRNDPCRCGSGKKYKRCCLDSDKPSEVVASEGVSAAALEAAEECFDAKDRGRGPARDMMDFAQPLIDATDGSIEQMNKALSFAMVCWNLAILDPAEREKGLAEMVNELCPDEGAGRDELRRLLLQMIERHEEMFPGIHRRRR
jgi:SWIM/SEC-C metal-binding protein